MRKTSILFLFLLFSLMLFCQSQPFLKKDNKANSDTTAIPARVILRCGYNCNNQTPLIIVDGVPIPGNRIGGIDPNDIDSIWILRDVSAKAFYGCRANNGVILITTKQNKHRKFIIKDADDESQIPGATVSFIAIDKTDSVIMAANDIGLVSTNKLKPSKKYKIKVSAVGYKTYIADIFNSYRYAEKEVRLERCERFCTEAIISCPALRKISCGIEYSSIINKDQRIAPDRTFSKAKVFPNPAQRGGIVTIEYEPAVSPIFLKLAGLDGRVIMLQKQKTIKGINRFAINVQVNWAAGTYLLQVYENGRIAASEKIIIQ